MNSVQRPLRVLELFAGSRSIGKAAEFLGMEVRSIDLMPYDGMHKVGDVMGMHPTSFRSWKPDIIWASPPCTAFSVASMGSHWGGGKKKYIPKSANAFLGQALVMRTLEIIRACKPDVWFIENPMGVLRNLPLMAQVVNRHTVTYCTYNDHRQKRTDIWTNCTEWKPKAECKKNQPCHIAAPRGARTGTQGLKGAHQRAIIPPALCVDVMTAALKQLTKGGPHKQKATA